MAADGLAQVQYAVVFNGLPRIDHTDYSVTYLTFIYVYIASAA